MQLMKQGKTLLEGRKIRTMYQLSCRFAGAATGTSESYVHATAALWHRRLGHPGSQVVSQLVKNSAVKGLDTVDLPKEKKGLHDMHSS
jgi:hypothetical protein